MLGLCEAVDANLSHSEFLFRLCSDEAERRESRQLDLRMRRASFDGLKRLEDFEWAFNPQIPKAKIIDLATCNFVGRKANVVLTGPAGVGKSHIAQALGERACRMGHSVFYTSAHRMLSDLRAARADQTLPSDNLTSPDVIVIVIVIVLVIDIDDLGLRPLEFDEPIDLYEAIRQRYELGSIIVTSNRDLDESSTT